MFQSTPPRGGATFERRGVNAKDIVSIHAPARGGDTVNDRSPDHFFCFNPRPRAGGDMAEIGIPELSEVSIHAPARGATRFVKQYFCKFMFQSTPPRGGRPRHIL